MAKFRPQERIVCAAIWYKNAVCTGPYSKQGKFAHQPRNVRKGFVACGLRHCNCFGVLAALYPDRRHLLERACVQGFITTENRFVDRKAAAAIAFATCQVLVPNPHHDGLHSEDLY